MNIELKDGRNIDVLAVACYDELLRAIAIIGLLDASSLSWLRNRLAEAGNKLSETASMDGDVETVYFLNASKALCDSYLDDERYNRNSK